MRFPHAEAPQKKKKKKTKNKQKTRRRRVQGQHLHKKHSHSSHSLAAIFNSLPALRRSGLNRLKYSLFINFTNSSRHSILTTQLDNSSRPTSYRKLPAASYCCRKIYNVGYVRHMPHRCNLGVLIAVARATSATTAAASATTVWHHFSPGRTLL